MVFFFFLTAVANNKTLILVHRESTEIAPSLKSNIVHKSDSLIWLLYLVLLKALDPDHEKEPRLGSWNNQFDRNRINKWKVVFVESGGEGCHVYSKYNTQAQSMQSMRIHLIFVVWHKTIISLILVWRSKSHGVWMSGGCIFFPRTPHIK